MQFLNGRLAFGIVVGTFWILLIADQPPALAILYSVLCFAGFSFVLIIYHVYPKLTWLAHLLELSMLFYICWFLLKGVTL